MRWEPLQENRPLPRRRAGDRARLDRARLPPSLKPAFDRGERDAEDLDNLPAIHAAVDGFQHLQPEILRVWFHARKYPRGSSYKQPAVRRCDHGRWLCAGLETGTESGATEKRTRDGRLRENIRGENIQQGGVETQARSGAGLLQGRRHPCSPETRPTQAERIVAENGWSMDNGELRVGDIVVPDPDREDNEEESA